MFPEDKVLASRNGIVVGNSWRCAMLVVMVFLVFCIVSIPLLMFKMNDMYVKQEQMQVLMNELQLQLENQKDSYKANVHPAKRDVTETNPGSNADLIRCRDGRDGLPGTDGVPGYNGNDGRDGIPGSDGRDGTPGSGGSDGRDGRDGSSGSIGPRGVPGSSGSAGQKGERGDSGIPGKVGPAGPPGAMGDTDSEDRHNRQESTTSNGNFQNATGSVYTRWGRNQCDGDTDLVYMGIIGGAEHNQAGGGSNYQCLTLDPKFDDVVSGANALGGYMYGTEYQVTSFGPLSNIHNHDAVCAVCRIRTRASVLMIPGTNECPSEEWTREYYGYIMSSHSTRKRSQFICVDRHPEGRIGGNANLDGALLYPVEGKCGSLPCGPYIDGHELTCAVCSI